MNASNRVIYNLTESIDSLSYMLFKLGWALFFIIAMFGIILWVAILVKHGKRYTWPHKFNSAKASNFFESGKVEELIAYCDKHYKNYPNDIWINWYYGIAYYNLGDKKVSDKYFKMVIKLNPSWEIDANPYLQEIKDNNKNVAHH